MNRFRYTARGIDGKRTRGEVRALNPEEAIHQLQDAGVYVTSIIPISDRRRLERVGRVALSETERIFFLESWAMMLEAGLPMQSALLRLRMASRNPSLVQAIDAMRLAIDNGVNLTEALRVSRLFQPSWIAVLSVGEQVGDFIQPLKTLHQNALTFRRLKQKLLSMTLMPAILLGMVILWFWLFTVKVVPSLVYLVSQMGLNLPLPALLTVSADLVQSGIRWFILVVCALVLLCRVGNRADQETGIIRSWLPTSLPVIGPLISQFQLIVIATGLRVQIEAGIPLMKAMETLSHGISNREIRRDLLQAYGKLREGVPVTEALSQLEVIPSIYHPIIAAGEASGKLPEMLDFLVRDAQANLTEQAKRLVVLLRSFVILSAGLLIGLILVTFFGLLLSSIGKFPG